ncbi:MAG: BREX-3 system P-loop-containing protein BrxF [Verrucomicrobiota bacterium]|jgi:DNA polymerase III delta prime subunit
MAETIHEKLQSALRTVDTLYYRLVLLVGPSGVGKTSVLRAFAEETGTSLINVNLALSRELLEMTATQRALRLSPLLDQITREANPPFLLDNLEILFDKDLKQDPLRLLQGMSRNRPVVAAWNGTFKGGNLTYAAPGHPEYRYYDSQDALIISMNSTTEGEEDRK